MTQLRIPHTGQMGGSSTTFAPSAAGRSVLAALRFGSLELMEVAMDEEGVEVTRLVVTPHALINLTLEPVTTMTHARARSTWNLA